MYFVESNTCIYFLNGKFSSIREKFLSVSPKEIKTSSAVKGKLLLGAFKSRTREKTRNRKRLITYTRPLYTLNFPISTTMFAAFF